jgi:hypothetical protein
MIGQMDMIPSRCRHTREQEKSKAKPPPIKRALHPSIRSDKDGSWSSLLASCHKCVALRVQRCTAKEFGKPPHHRSNRSCNLIQSFWVYKCRTKTQMEVEHLYMMDLTKTTPRSVSTAMLGIVQLARTTDKAKAVAHGSIGEYK